MFDVSLEKKEDGNDEVIIRYREMSSKVKDLLGYIENNNARLMGKDGAGQHLLDVSSLFYFESVDERVFAYTQEAAYQVDKTLNDLELMFKTLPFFRCGKSLIINVQKISYLQSIMGGRIDVTLKNEEHLIISRHYARAFREQLKGDKHE